VSEGETAFSRVEKLAANHDLAAFDCGQEPLNQFLRRFALVGQKSGSSQTYVVRQNQGPVVGYYSLTVGSVEHANAPPRVIHGMARHPIPVMLLARLAVDQTVQNRGLGKALLKDALLRTAQAADLAGIRALLVHAKDDAARRWYERFGFEPSQTDPYHQFLLLKDLHAVIGG
jgi:GNAT superfamily N-acetyltransferase